MVLPLSFCDNHIFVLSGSFEICVELIKNNCFRGLRRKELARSHCGFEQFMSKKTNAGHGDVSNFSLARKL